MLCRTPSSVLIIVLCAIQTSDASPLRKSNKSREDVMCSDIPMEILEGILGGAFNPRYMSVDAPIEEDEHQTSSKRTVSGFIDDFYVDDTFNEVLDDAAAWDVSNHVTIAKRMYGFHSRKRRAVNYMQEWHCKSKVVWMDLGLDYFPRYIRSVKCLGTNCWFGIYKCKPRSFTVKILRRKRGYCSQIKNSSSRIVGSAGLPNDLKQLWVWEERAINFCCDCVR